MNGRYLVSKNVLSVLGLLRPDTRLSSDRTATVLYYLLLALFTWNGFWTIVLLRYSTGHPPHLTVIGLIEAALLAALVQLRLGSLKAASWIYLVGVWLFATAVVAQNGGIRSPVLALYVTLPVSAAWLQGYRVSLRTAGVCLASSLVFAAFEMANVRLPRTIPGTPIGICIQLAGAVLMAVIPLAQVLRVLTEALAKSQEHLENLRREEEKLRESEERFRNVANAAPLMIWTAGPDMGCTFVNKAWLDFTGRTLEHELGDGWTANVHPDDLPDGHTIYKAAFQVRRNIELEYRKRRADGEYRWVLSSGVPRFAPDGQFLGYIGTCVDITDLKHGRDEDAARQKLENVGSLAGGIAHDFNNILGGILAQSELGLAELAAGVLPEGVLESIRAVAIRGTGIGRQLMIYAGQESAISEPVDISSLIEDMRELLKVAVSKHAVVTTELARDVSPVHANPAQLRRVVMNLVTNASDAIGEQDGMIVIRTRLVTAVVNSTRGGTSECIALEISDTGVGISREAQSKMFDPFFTTKSTGHGLGLSVVQRIVQGLGGAIQVDTELGRGTRFRILLPIAGEMARPARPATAIGHRGELNCDGITLMVEDESSLRHAVASMLRVKGLRVVEAADGTEALASIHEHKDDIALVLLDVSFPGVPCREVLTEARRVRQDVKVIGVSAYGQDTVDASFPGMRIDAFLRKPYTFAELMSLMVRVLCAEGGESRAKTSTN